MGGLGGDFFKLLGQFAGQGHRAFAQRGQRLRQLLDAVRGFQQHHAARLARQHLHCSGAFGLLDGQEPCKHKTPLFGAVGHGPCGTEGRGDAAGSWQRHRAQPCLAHGLGQPGAGVAHAGRACVAHIRHTLPLLQPLHHLLGRLGFVVLVHGQQLVRAFIDAIGPQQRLGVARVLAGHRVCELQYVQRAQGDVGQVADGRGDDVQGALRIMLRCGRIACGGQCCCERCAQ